jgi:hypothetical protein
MTRWCHGHLLVPRPAGDPRAGLHAALRRRRPGLARRLRRRPGALPLREAHREGAGGADLRVRGPGPGDRRDLLQRRQGPPGRLAPQPRRAGRPGGLRLPVPVRRVPGRRPRLPRRLHARLLPVRPRPQARLPGRVRRGAPLQRRPQRRRDPARRAGPRPGGQAGARAPPSEPGLRHQVETRGGRGRGGTSLPIRRSNMRSASAASSMRIRRRVRWRGSMVVSASWSASISPRPL